MKRKSYWLSLLALILILTAAVRPAIAYFTDNSQADGAIPVSLGFQTTIEEQIEGLTKTVKIKNTGDYPVWVRAIAYAGQTYTLSISGWGSSYSGPGNGADWVYYPSPVPAGGSADGLIVTVTPPEAGEFSVASFNVSVQYESIPVEYNSDGSVKIPTASDWENNILDVVSESSS